MKIVINKCYGGFNLSYQACMRYAELSGFKLYAWVNHGHDFDSYFPYVPSDKEPFIIYYTTKPLTTDGKMMDDSYWSGGDIERHDPILLQVVEELGSLVNSRVSDLRIVDIPDDIEYVIEEYDGLEHIAEKHRTWY